MQTFAQKMKRKFSVFNKFKPRQSGRSKVHKTRRSAASDATPETPRAPQVEGSMELQQNNDDKSNEIDKQVQHQSSISHTWSTCSESSRPETTDDAPNEIMESVATNNGSTDETEMPDRGRPWSDEHAPVEDEQISAQQQREMIYLIFNGEDETDYTEGPARMVIASDGVKPACASLLMTLDVSRKIQRAIIASREFAKVERVAERKREVYSQFRDDLTAEIANHNLRLLQGNVNDDEEKQRDLRKALESLEEMLEVNELRQQRVKNDLEYRGGVVRHILREADEELEEAFICAQLLEPQDDTPDTPIEDLDLQKEYQAFIAPSAAGSVVTAVATPLDTSRDHMFVPKPELTEEQRRRNGLTEALFSAQERLQTAQFAFDRREGDRAHDRLARDDAVARGDEVEDETQEAFDHRWFKKIQGLTHEVIEAESALSAAKAAAAEEGVDVLTDDGASGFADDAADGYRISMEQAMIDSVPSPAIKDWVSGIPEVASPSFHEQQASSDADEWEGDEIQISDSVSMVAQDAGDRKRIDKWKRVCGIE